MHDGECETSLTSVSVFKINSILIWKAKKFMTPYTPVLLFNNFFSKSKSKSKSKSYNALCKRSLNQLQQDITKFWSHSGYTYCWMLGI